MTDYDILREKVIKAIALLSNKPWEGDPGDALLATIERISDGLCRCETETQATIEATQSLLKQKRHWWSR